MWSWYWYNNHDCIKLMTAVNLLFVQVRPLVSTKELESWGTTPMTLQQSINENSIKWVFSSSALHDSSLRELWSYSYLVHKYFKLDIIRTYSLDSRLSYKFWRWFHIAPTCNTYIMTLFTCSKSYDLCPTTHKYAVWHILNFNLSRSIKIIRLLTHRPHDCRICLTKSWSTSKTRHPCFACIRLGPNQFNH